MKRLVIGFKFRDIIEAFSRFFSISEALTAFFRWKTQPKGGKSQQGRVATVEKEGSLADDSFVSLPTSPATPRNCIDCLRATLRSTVTRHERYTGLSYLVSHPPFFGTR